MILRTSVLLCAAVALLPAQTGGVVNGRVTNSVNGQAVKRAYVVLRGLPGSDASAPVETYICQTGPDGRFSVANVAPGRYQAEPSRAGFQAKPPDRAANATYLPQIVVETGKPVAGLELRLIPLGIIGGNVVDESGDAVAKADVEVMQYRYTGGRKVLSRVQTKQTDDRGEYFFSDLPPGRYYLRASNLEHDPPLIGGVENRGPSRTRVYAPGYYGGAHEASQATALAVAAGAELERVDIPVRRVFIYAIRGTAPAGSNVNLVRPAGEPGFAYATRPIGESHEGFEIDGIPPGTYPVRVTVPQKAGLFAFRRVEVRDQDVEGLDLRSPTGREVSGSVQLADPSAGPMGSLLVILQPEEAGAGTRADCPVAADGTFALTGQPDAYFLRVQAPAGSYLQSVKLGDRQLADNRLNPGSDSGKLALVLAKATGTIEGAVTDAQGGPARLVKVTLIPDQSVPFWADLFQNSLTDGNGKFSFTGVAPGNYKVYAWTDVEMGAPEDSDFRKPFESQGAAVRMETGGSATVSLKAIDTSNQ